MSQSEVNDLNPLEWILDEDGEQLALIVYATHEPDVTEFLTNDELTQQLGFIVYKKDEKISPHEHKPVERSIVGTPEVILVRKGKIEASIFSKERKLVAKKILQEGDTLLLVAGGHGFRMLEDTVLMEVKQGPYIGFDDKIQFEKESP